MLGTVFMVIAAFCLAIAALGLFGKVGLEHPLGWVATGLTFWAIAVLIGFAHPLVDRYRGRPE